MNSLIMAVRQNRITFDKVTRFAHALSALPIHIESPIKPAFWNPLLTSATETRLTIYDAAYLELARRMGLPLATLDRELATAARAAAVPLIALS